MTRLPSAAKWSLVAGVVIWTAIYHGTGQIGSNAQDGSAPSFPLGGSPRQTGSDHQMSSKPSSREEVERITPGLIHQVGFQEPIKERVAKRRSTRTTLRDAMPMFRLTTGNQNVDSSTAIQDGQPASQPGTHPLPLSPLRLTPEDLETLKELPPVCASDLPGLPLAITDPNPLGAHAETIRSSSDLEASGEIEFRSGHLPNPHVRASAGRRTLKNLSSDATDPHWEVYSKTAYPSATECATCHQQIYEEWAGSSHAYASVSPMFQVFEDKVNKLTQGTIGYFCMRCHAPVATTMGLRRDQAIWDGPRVFREGVTCVACHRVKQPYTKSNGERRIEPGDLTDPVYGAGDGAGVELAKQYKQYLKIKTSGSDTGPGQPMHRQSIQFEELSASTFCMSCHQVAVPPGVKLEVVWDQYRASPAFREGTSCQDCHMGRVPGVNSGYTMGPAAVVNEKIVSADRKHSNHMFYGPGYSIAHPGVFPHNGKADQWTFNEWLEFDWRAGWGTELFENALTKGTSKVEFPAAWNVADDRYEAREIIEANLAKLRYKKDIRRQVLENGSKLDGPYFRNDPAVGAPLRFHYCITNTNNGHNLPSGSLGAQPQLWLNTVLIGPDGNRLWESGYTDSRGDLADQHSLDVLAGKVPLDRQLMNLQTKFLTTNVKGTDREMYLPLNFDLDQLPFIRPAAQPVSVINHPPFIRMESHSIAPLGSRKAKYVVPARLMQKPGTYRLSVRLRSRAEPIYFMRFCDATPEMQRMMNEWMVDFHMSTVTFEVR